MCASPAFGLDSQVLERLAPDAGARLATRLWFTVPPAGSPRPYPPDGTPFVVDVHGRSVRGQRWGNRDGAPIAYLVHGWGGHGAQLGGFVQPLVDAGFTVVAYDALSHGASAAGADGSRQTTLLEMADALLLMESEHGTADTVITHSAGGIATALAFADGMRPRRAVFIAPAIDPASVTSHLARQLGFGERIRLRMIERAERRLRLPVSHFIVPDIAARLDPAPPLLVVHDRADRESPWEEGAKLADSWPAARLYSTEGLGHRRILTDPRVIDEVVAFVATADRNA